jgi:signal transduction histidine kinase
MNNGMVKYWIKDNGKGLSIEDQEKLYKKNTRLDPHRAEGYGFGLSIIKRIVTKLGGEVGVESNISNRKGTTFYFTLKASE